ncbi:MULTISPECIES: flagellar motor switch protein FliN [Bacillus cereus group]|uniref:flagellar motor switch protein FliN n=1 Tax=Bacillus cereus group TaxID=86661 RepID=UPI0022E1D491|nr:flagellar motor switch protein FliN [Bacillus cereus group sp. TH152-1LC]MDA1674916.1 flagellar motor switch protein FliN [Bacillus cereus group sp. TH152-1LC]
MFWSLFQMIIVFGAMGAGIYYFVKKMKTNQFNKIGDSGKIKVIDGINLTYQTSSYLLDVDGQLVFVVIGPNGINTTPLKEKRFEELMNSGFEKTMEKEENEYDNENE